MSKYKKILKFLLLLLFNNILIGMVLGFIWYKLGYVKLEIQMSSGIDTFKTTFASHKVLYLLILSIIEFLSIIIFKKLFKTKKDYITYYIISIILSLIIFLISSFGFDTGNYIIKLGEIKDKDIFKACLGLRYISWILTLNIPTLIGILYNNRKEVFLWKK